MIEKLALTKDAPIIPRATLDDDAGTLSQVRKNPMVMYGVFTELVKQIYLDANNLPLNCPFTWDADKTKTKVWIGSEYEWEDEKVDFRPAIYISLGEMKSKLDQSVTRGTAIDVDLQNGRILNSRYVEGTIDIKHVGHTRGEALMLASTTYDYIDGLADIIRDDLCFTDLMVAGCRPVSISKESRERISSDVLLVYKYQISWYTKLESPKLKRLRFAIDNNN